MYTFRIYFNRWSCRTLIDKLTTYEKNQKEIHCIPRNGHTLSIWRLAGLKLIKEKNINKLTYNKMKNLKSKVVASFLAFALICGGYMGLTAMNNHAVLGTKKLTQQWYVFTSPLNPGDTGYEDALTNPSNYSPINSSSIPSECPQGEEKVCSILVTPDQDDSQRPDQSELDNLLDEMTNPHDEPSSVVFKPEDN
jgi:hypothetical protein